MAAGSCGLQQAHAFDAMSGRDSSRHKYGFETVFGTHPMTQELPEMLTRQQVADMIGVGRNRLDRTGYPGPVFVRIGGRTIRYRRSDVLAWLNANAVV